MSNALECRLLIVERRPCWAALVERRLAHVDVRVIECRTLAEVDARLRETPACVVAVEASLVAPAVVAESVARWRRHCPAAVFVVLGESAAPFSTELWEEVGVALICPNMAETRILAALVEQFAACQEPASGGLRGAIWARLPWREADPGRTWSRPKRPRRGQQAPPVPGATDDEPIEFEPLGDDESN